jgi:hypothetical protein
MSKSLSGSIQLDGASAPSIRYRDEAGEFTHGSKFCRHDLHGLAEAAREAASRIRLGPVFQPLSPVSLSHGTGTGTHVTDSRSRRARDILAFSAYDSHNPSISQVMQSLVAGEIETAINHAAPEYPKCDKLPS